MDAQPLVLGSNLPKAREGAMGMHGIGIAGHHIGGNLDILQLRNLVLPVGIHESVGHYHAGLVLKVILAGEGVKDGLGKDWIGNTATVGSLPEVVHKAFPGSDGSQMWRLLPCDEPLGHREPGIAAHANPAIAPRLLCRPLNGVVSVLGVLAPPVVKVALRVICPPAVRVDNDIAVAYPIGRVGTLEFFQAGSGCHRYPRPHGHVVQHLAADFLAIRAPGHQCRVPAFVSRSEYISVNDSAVTQGNGSVLLHYDVTGQRHGALTADSALFQQQGFCLVLCSTNSGGSEGIALAVIDFYGFTIAHFLRKGD